MEIRTVDEVLRLRRRRARRVSTNEHDTVNADSYLARDRVVAQTREVFATLWASVTVRMEEKNENLLNTHIDNGVDRCAGSRALRRSIISQDFFVEKKGGSLVPLRGSGKG